MRAVIHRTRRVLGSGQGFRTILCMVAIIGFTVLHAVREDVLGEKRWLHIVGVLAALGGIALHSAVTRGGAK
jgi:hypothetical protein